MKSSKRPIILLGIFLVAALWIRSVLAQDEAEIPSITIEYSADGLDLPDELPAGRMTLVFENTSETPFGPG